MLRFLRVKIPLPVVVLVIVLTGAATVFFIFQEPAFDSARDKIEQTASVAAILPAPQAPAVLGQSAIATAKNDLIQNGALFIEADLAAMKLRVWQNSSVIKEVPILTIGREGSWWETPTGIYQIKSKERNHFSSFGHVYQPWSMVFQGNFFIHGWPYYPNGEDVSSAYSGGCIRLSTADAKAIYALVSTGTPVLVSKVDPASDNFTYTPKNIDARPGAPVYLAADLKNRYVFASGGDINQAEPIASVTKLVTALVAAEYINLDKNITVSQKAIVPTSLPRLKAGEEYSAYQLLYPLLDESSNEAAFALADALGRERFVKLMNDKATALGMNHTHFVDPAGMSAENVSSPADLFALAQYLLENRSFILKITAGTLGPNVYGSSEFKDLQNFNIFTGQSDFMGGKVGETTAAGHTMLSVFNENLGGADRPIAILVLGSRNQGEDINTIKNAILNSYASP